jgi:hypothetical protein
MGKTFTFFSHENLEMGNEKELWGRRGGICELMNWEFGWKVLDW